MDTLNEDFDLAAFEDVLSSELTIRDPLTGAPTPLVITIAGPEHPDRKRDEFARSRRMRAELMKTGKVQLEDPEEEEADATERIARYILGWKGLRTPYTPAAALALVSDPKRRWLREQIRVALEERDRFIQRSAAA